MIRRNRIRMFVGASIAPLVAMMLAACGGGPSTPPSTAQVAGIGSSAAAESNIPEVVITAPAPRPEERVSDHAPAADATPRASAPQLVRDASSRSRSKHRGG